MPHLTRAAAVFGPIAGLLLTCTPLLAQPIASPALQEMVAELQADEPAARLGGAIAACLTHAGDPDMTASAFQDHGWLAEAEPEMGIIMVNRPEDEQIWVWLADDGSSCRIWSEEVGTDETTSLLHQLLDSAEIDSEDSLGEIDCPALMLPGVTSDLLIEVTSSGNDPTCNQNSASAVHITLGEG